MSMISPRAFSPQIISPHQGVNYPTATVFLHFEVAPSPLAPSPYGFLHLNATSSPYQCFRPINNPGLITKNRYSPISIYGSTCEQISNTKVSQRTETKVNSPRIPHTPRTPRDKEISVKPCLASVRYGQMFIDIQIDHLEKQLKQLEAKKNNILEQKYPKLYTRLKKFKDLKYRIRKEIKSNLATLKEIKSDLATLERLRDRYEEIIKDTTDKLKLQDRYEEIIKNTTDEIQQQPDYKNPDIEKLLIEQQNIMKKIETLHKQEDRLHKKIQEV